VISILEKKRQNVSDYKIEISGERREEYPQAFVKFHVHHIVYGRDVSEQAVAQAIELSDTKVLFGRRDSSTDGGNHDRVTKSSKLIIEEK
jgi:hypothetical protein